MAYKLGRDDYAAITDEANDPAIGPVEVDASEYYEMLGCVPPIYVPGGFLVGEAMTGDQRGTVFAHYAKRGEKREQRYLAKYAVAGRPETFIKGDA